MKKKKLLSLALASVLAVTSVAAMGCPAPEEKPGPTPGGCTDHVDADSNGKCDVCNTDVERTGDCYDNHYDNDGDDRCDWCDASMGTGGGEIQQRKILRFGGYWVDAPQKESYEKMVSEFNTGYGLKRGIYIQPTLLSKASYDSQFEQMLQGSEGADVFMISDRNFKTKVQSNGDLIRDIGDLTGDPAFEDQLDNMWKGMIDRFRLNVNGWTSYEDDNLWAVPVDSNPTALYYNRTVLENNGIIVISIEDETITAANFTALAEKYAGLSEVGLTAASGKTLLDLWNDDKIEDLFGNKYSALKFEIGDTIPTYYSKIEENEDVINSSYLSSMEVEIPAKGFFRSGDEYRVYDPSLSAVDSFIEPGQTEVLLFNASIAMSWEEMEDIALLCTKNPNYNLKSKSEYGFYTQWWFTYGWTVGGDCVEDMTGDGAWAFSLSDYTANYIVTEAGCTQSNPNNPADPNKYYIGEYTGSLYSAGQTLSFLDKMQVAPLTINPTTQAATAGDIVTPIADGGFRATNAATNESRLLTSAPTGAGVYTSDAGIRQSVKSHSAKTQDGSANTWFVELPSTKEAFAHFVHLCPSEVDPASLGVSYATSSSATDEGVDIQNLANNRVAFVIERGDKLGLLRNYANEHETSWGVANLPIFKEYADDGVTVARQGVQSGHSECVALGITKKCADKNLEAAFEFIQWMSADYYSVDAAGNYYFGAAKNAADTQFNAGQAVKANTGYIPNQEGLFEVTEAGAASFIKEGEEHLNLQIFAYAIEYEAAGDWWYLPNGSSTWINAWASSLNSASGVRGGKTTLDAWFEDGIILATNKILDSSFNYYYDDANNIANAWQNAMQGN